MSRLLRMYAEDLAGEANSTAEYRRGMLRFIAEHTGEPFETIADYAVVYNTYDWGLNDSHRGPQLRPIRFHESVETFHAQDGVLRELYLYDGNFCNRAGTWCTVFGSPQGWYSAHTTRVLEGALAAVARDGNIKFYGGEPTLHSDSLVPAMRFLRQRGFQGLFTIYSNGVKAHTLIDLLESDPQSEAARNYSIYLGRDAEPLPKHAKTLLEAWSRANPMRLFSGYKVLYHAGARSGYGPGALTQHQVPAGMPAPGLAPSWYSSIACEGGVCPCFPSTPMRHHRHRWGFKPSTEVVLKEVRSFHVFNFTAGCTTQAATLRQYYPQLQDLGAQVLGVSCDHVASSRAWVTALESLP